MDATPTPTVDRPARGPVRRGERSTAPDLARGLMLLLIVTSNAMFFLWAVEYDASGQTPVAGSAADVVAQFVMTVTLDMRTYPLFAFLFGYGMVQVFQRQTGAGTSERGAVRLLRRRSLWLLLFGFLHAALLLASDILAAYGLISLVLGALFLRRADRTLVRWVIAGGAVLTLLFLLGAAYLAGLATGGITPPTDAASGGQSPAEMTGTGDDGYLASMAARLLSWQVLTVLPVLGFTAPAAMLLGFLAARRRVLDEPGRHLRLLRRTAVVGVAVGWLGALPAALVRSGAWTPSESVALAEPGLLAMQWSSGLAGGVGYVAVFGLVAHHLSARARTSVPVVAVCAVGKRSLSCYLAHSLLLGPVLAAWGLGLGGHLTSATAMLYAFGAWLVTVILAHRLERLDRRGPAEVVLRRLMYGR